ncbi:hypothetical protein [Halolamina rubra]|uniref:hypothetical protein n=1 Tax=Halolamina rubra TaxID=1380430 RepID=UPI0012ABD493|nr:hypothetical protein [Halolamina rubra]
MSIAARSLRWLGGKAEVRRDGSSVIQPRYWLHKVIGAKLHWLADRLEGDDV